MIIKSGELKAIPNPFEESDREQIDFIRDVVLEMQKEFIGLVKEEREISTRINVKYLMAEYLPVDKHKKSI